MFDLENTSPTAAMQRYAAEVFRLQQDHETVGLPLLGEYIDVSAQAISRMIKKMEGEGYLTHEPYQGVRLTQSGEKIAMPALRRHRLSEVFLVRVMGYDWASAHDLTDTFELGINEDLEDRMDDLTGHPTRCPHGEPIPTKEGEIIYPNDISMVEIGSKVHGRISRVRTHDLDKLRYIGELGLVPGKEFYLLSCAPFQGPLRLQMDNLDQVIGYELARVLWVELVEEED